MKPRRIKRLIFLLTAFILITITLTGCTFKAGKESKDNHEQLNQPTVSTSPQGGSDTVQTIPANSDARYFFLDGYLVGSWQGGTWHSLNVTNPEDDGISTSYYIKDLLAPKEYTLYNMKGIVGTTNRLSWNTGEGLGGFEADMTGVLAPYSKAKEESEYYRQFRLPTRLGEECANIKVPGYAFYTDFDHDNVILATNTTAAVLPQKTIQGEDLNNSEKQKLKDLLIKNNVQAEPNITNSLRCDFDNDGEEEYLIIANTIKGENGYPYVSEYELSHPSGSYSIVLFKEHDGSVRTIFSQFRPYQNPPKQAGEFFSSDNCHNIELLGAYDLNSDGRFEICLSYQQWESGRVFVIEPAADGTFPIVMLANFGL